VRLRYAVASSCLFLALGAAGCAGSGKPGASSSQTGSTTLTVYSSVALQTPSAAQGQAVVDGEKLALAQAGGRVGKFTVRYVSLDDSSAKAGRWDPVAVSSNARQAAQDKSTIAYLGELDPDASAISIPILNEVGVLQITPGDTYLGFTRSQDADVGEPEKYYPSGNRTFGRVVPADEVQGAAQVAYQRHARCTRLFVLTDRGVYGDTLARVVVRDTGKSGPTVVGQDRVDLRRTDFGSTVEKIQASRPDCVFYGGTANPDAARLWTDVGRAAPAAKLFGSHVLTQRDFLEAIGPLGRRTYLTAPALDQRLYPPGARAFATAYRHAFHRAPGLWAIYGYEAMRVTLDAIRAAGAKGNDRQAVVNAFFKTRDRRSVLGTYSIDQDGDPTITSYGGYRVVRGAPRFDRVLTAAGAS